MNLVAGGTWPQQRTRVLDWLVHEAREVPFLDDLFGELCARLVADGLPLARSTIQLQVLHPQFVAGQMLWEAQTPAVRMTFFEHARIRSDAYLHSPVRAIFEQQVGGLRRRLGKPGDNYEYPIYAELAERGLTDYVAMPLIMTDGRRHAWTLATDDPAGFSGEDLFRIDELLPVLAMAAEIRINRRTAKNILATYVGKDAGARVLAGEITRGSGGSIQAALWTCDMRGFTTISETWPRDDVIAWLNDYFDAMAEPVEKRGGEILKFIGDAMLAIFRIDDPAAPQPALRHAVDAACEAVANMHRLNAERRGRGLPELGFGIALHVGEVMYGNIGSRTRLDFTVIGPAVNLVSRLEQLTRVLDREVLVSAAFAEVCDQDCMVHVGTHELRGVGRAVEVYALKELER